METPAPTEAAVIGIVNGLLREKMSSAQQMQDRPVQDQTDEQDQTFASMPQPMTAPAPLARTARSNTSAPAPVPKPKRMRVTQPKPNDTDWSMPPDTAHYSTSAKTSSNVQEFETYNPEVFSPMGTKPQEEPVLKVTSTGAVEYVDPAELQAENDANNNTY